MSTENNIILSASIEERAIELIINGIDPIEAIKQAIQQEQKLIEEMIAQQSQRAKQAMNQIRKNVYGLIHIMN